MMWNLPRAWAWTPLGPHLLERAEAIGSLAPEEAARFDRLRGVSNREGIIDPPFDRVRPIKDPSRYVVLRVGYFAYNPMRINVGSIGLVRGEAQAGKISPDYVVFTTRRTLLPEYLFAYLKSDVGRQIIRASTAGAVRERLYFRDLARLPIPLPPPLQQRRIVRLLDAAEELRHLRDQADRRTADLIPAIFHEMFGDPIMNPRKWCRASLDDVCTKLTDGTHRSPPAVETGVPYITAKHLRKHGLDFQYEPTYVSPDDHREIYARCDPKPGDVLYIKDGATTGLAAVNHYAFEFSMLSSLALLRPDPAKCEGEYLCAWLNDGAVKASILSQMAGSAIRRLTLAKLKRAPMLLPPLALQRQFAARVAEVRTLEAHQAASRRRLDDLYQSLLHRAFRGEI